MSPLEKKIYKSVLVLLSFVLIGFAITIGSSHPLSFVVELLCAGGLMVMAVAW